tara:strand:- start:1313 stop:1486 length:174 start_codon:yes stop_codon:yes gene_type:complete
VRSEGKGEGERGRHGDTETGRLGDWETADPRNALKRQQQIQTRNLIRLARDGQGLKI